MAELRPYNPTWRDRLAQMLMGDGHASPERRQFVEGALGSTGLGTTGVGLADLVPGGQVLAAQEALQGGDPQGAALAIVPVPAARNLRMATKLPTDDIFRQAVERTPGASLEDDGLRMALQRHQKPEQSGEESVRTGVFYLPEGAPQARYYKNHRPTEQGTYGGREAISGETLYKNPLVAKGGTGGKVPEAAYDSLLGKGAYQKMRTDALHAVAPGWARLDHADQVELVERFLRQYAPERAGSGFAEHVLTNSRGGNLLPYALQELAVAHAVRGAGHDAVLGVTKSKGSPIFSEVFDVRESHYPTPDGGYQLMPEFEAMLPGTEEQRRKAMARQLMDQEQP